MTAFYITTVMVVAVAMAMALAHALEFPGKLQLSEQQYRTVQRIYYPGFTVAGAAEPIGLVMAATLLMMVPVGSTSFWLVLAACLVLALMHGVYWLLIHPVNRVWLEDTKLEGAGAKFFSADPQRAGTPRAMNWVALRDRWEYSHMVRAALSLAALALLLAAMGLS